MTDEERRPASPVSGDASYFDREVAWLRSDQFWTRWISIILSAALIIDVVLVGALACGPINVFHNDIFLLLDDGWRVLNGQVPHRDFYSPLGPVEFWIVAAGMRLTGAAGARGIAIGIAGFGLLVGAWGWRLCHHKMPPLFVWLVTAWLVLTATSPTPLGFDPRYLSCAMIYNRQGYALLGIVLLECALSLDKGSFWSGVSSGGACVTLAFLKLNFFGIAGLLLLVSLPLARAELARLWGLLTGAISALGILALIPGFSLAAFFADMSFVSHARGAGLNPAGALRAALTCAKSGAVWLVILLTLAIIVLLPPAKRRWRPTATLCFLGVVVLASGILFLQTNSLENRCQLASLWVIVLLDRVSAIHLETGKKSVTVILAALSLGGLAAAALPDIGSTLSLLGYQTAGIRNTGARVEAPGLESLRFFDSTSFYDKAPAGDGDGTFYVNCLDDGLTLLRSYSRPDESILALGFHNPFSYLLRRKPAEGGSSYLFVGNSMSETQMPSVDRVFGNAGLMIVPEYEGTHRDSDLFIQNFYRSYLVEHFHFVARSRYWSLYRRNQP